MLLARAHYKSVLLHEHRYPKGQATIPVAIRQHLGIQPGDNVEFTVIDDLVVVRKSRHSRAQRARQTPLRPVVVSDSIAEQQ